MFIMQNEIIALYELIYNITYYFEFVKLFFTFLS
ncbi:hypothetical protein [Staphylococcus phage vB_SauM-V1SA19]|nr:hypothetical protein [Staphylococcus phage vB_SauM-V1SA19]UVT34771.1 hypothetical protein [Staphylococcus phage vB_SauM-V1SA20]